MNIRIDCPYCAKRFTEDEARRGKKVRCPDCDRPFVIPRREDDYDDTEEPGPRRGSAWRGEREDDYRAVPKRTRPARRSADEESDDRPRLDGGKLTGLVVAVAVVGGLAILGVVAIALVFASRFATSPGLADQQQVAGENQPAPPPAPAANGMGQPERLAGGVPNQLDGESLRKVKRATVFLRVTLPIGGVAEGTGFFAVQPGIVVTNAHVLGMLRANSPPPRRVEVVVHSGEPGEEKMTGSLLGVDHDNDLAVLRVSAEASRLPAPLEVDSATKLTETQKVYVFGFPLGSQLGKNITVSESSVTSLRRDAAGELSQVQVNGGMHQGNSGGPVTDARGVVVGVSVAIIRGTQINFAIPGDQVKQALFGRFTTTRLGTLYADGGLVRLPVKMTCLDPFGRIRDVKVEVWTGAAGKVRPSAWREPQPQPGDGQRQGFPAAARDGAYSVEALLPPSALGTTYWVQPSLTNAAGARLWGEAVPLPFEAGSAVVRKPARIQFVAPASPIERTVKLYSNVTMTISKGAQSTVLNEVMESDMLESLNPDHRGIGTAIRLTMASCPFTRETDGRKAALPPQATAALLRYSPTFLVDARHAGKERGNRNFQVLPPALREVVECMYETVCNTYEATTLPVPNRTLQPLDTWPARVPLLIVRNGRVSVNDIHLTCTFDGVRSSSGRDEAHVTLAGVVRGRGASSNGVLGQAKGLALFDVEKGYFSRVKLTVDSEVDSEEAGVRVQVSDENEIRRTEGNTLGIEAATQNQPATQPTRPATKRRPSQ